MEIEERRRHRRWAPANLSCWLVPIRQGTSGARECIPTMSTAVVTCRLRWSRKQETCRDVWAEVLSSSKGWFGPEEDDKEENDPRGPTDVLSIGVPS